MAIFDESDVFSENLWTNRKIFRFRCFSFRCRRRPNQMYIDKSMYIRSKLLKLKLTFIHDSDGQNSCAYSII